MRHRLVIPAALLALLLAARPAEGAGPFQDIDALEARLANALGAGIGEPGGAATPIDRRLKLAACRTPVTIDPPALGAVALRCPALGWRIRVPLARLAMAGAAPGVAMRAEPVVRRGDPVELVAESDGFSVSVGATAQEDGAPGARIRVRADADGRSQGQLMFAQVIDAGRVKLPGF